MGVFDKVEITAGKINELHCLESTKKEVDLGKIENITTHSTEELVKLALEVSGLSAAGEASAFPWETLPVSTEATLEAADRLIAGKVTVDLGTVDTVLAQKLDVGGGTVKK